MARNLVKNSDDVRQPSITPLNADSHADLPPAILVANGFDPLRDVSHAYATKLAKAGNDLTYVHNPDLTHGSPSSRDPDSSHLERHHPLHRIDDVRDHPRCLVRMLAAGAEPVRGAIAASTSSPSRRQRWTVVVPIVKPTARSR